MAYRNHHPHDRHSGTARDTHRRDYSGSHSVTRPINESSTQPSEHSSRRRRAVVDERQNRRSDHEENAEAESDSDSDYDPRYRSGQSDNRRQLLPYDTAPRSWQLPNSEVYRAVNNPTLQDAISTLRGRNRSHSRSSVRQLRPTPTNEQRLRVPSPDWYQRNSRPLGMSNLRDLDQNRNHAHAMERRFCEDQRAGPYDAVGHVRQQMEIERSEQHAHEREYRQQHRYEEYDEFDDRSSDTPY